MAQLINANSAPIKDEAEYEGVLKRIQELWGALPFTPEHAEINDLIARAEVWEEEHYRYDAAVAQTG